MKKSNAVSLLSALNCIGLYIERISGFFSVCLLAAMTVVVLVGVLFRYVMHSPFEWTEEISRFLMLIIVFLSINTAFRLKQHIALPFVVDRLPHVASRIVDYVAHGLIAFFLWFLMTKGYSMATGTLMTAGTIKISMFWLYLFVPLGALLTLIQLIFRVVEKLCTDFGLISPN